MLIIDGHLDLAMAAVVGRDLTIPLGPPAPHSPACVSLPDLCAGGVGLALATVFTQCDADPATVPYAYAGHDDLDGAMAAGTRQLEVYDALARAGAIRILRDREDLADVTAQPTDALPIVLLMECADPISDPSQVAWWHARGVRAVGLAWAMGSRYAGGDAAGGGLTDAGREMVCALDAFGILHDVSHLSAVGVDELLGLTAGPVIASHSNCRALVSEHDRHLSDAHIRAIGARGGVIGLNLYTRFLRKDRRATIDDAVAQIERVAEVAGIAATALGSDMDGGFGPDALPIGLDGPACLPRLLDALASRGWPDHGIAAFAHGNWQRVLHGALPSRDPAAGSTR